MFEGWDFVITFVYSKRLFFWLIFKLNSRSVPCVVEGEKVCKLGMRHEKKSLIFRQEMLFSWWDPSIFFAWWFPFRWATARGKNEMRWTRNQLGLWRWTHAENEIRSDSEWEMCNLICLLTNPSQHFYFRNIRHPLPGWKCVFTPTIFSPF